MNWIIIGALVSLFIILIMFVVRYFNKKIDKQKDEIKLFKNANEYQNDPMIVFSEKQEVIFANRSARKLFELKVHYENKKTEKELQIHIGNFEPQNLFKMIKSQEKISQGMIYLEKCILLIGEKKHRINLYVDQSKWNMDNSIICVFQDANSDFKEKEVTKKLAEMDFLTGLPSQFKASLDINNLAIEAQKKSERFALCLFDIHNFERMKVTLGHSYINNILKKFAQYLQDQERSDIEIYRLDCDNFLLVIKNFKREKFLMETVEDISASVTELFKKENKDSYIISSAGLALFPDHGKNANKLIDRAYLALMDANKRGNGSISIFEDTKHKSEEDEVRLSREIKSGLSKKEFTIYYAPIYDLETNTVSGAEALLMWNHPRLGMIGAEKFIKVAENTGQIIDIDNFLLKELIYQRKLWNDFNFRNIQLLVKISASQLHENSFIPMIKEEFETHGVDPQFFNFDVSQSISSLGMKDCHKEFENLQKLGIRLVIDNLDVGLSTIEQLHSKLIHTLTINHSLLQNSESQEVLKSIISLAHALDIEVRAEGVQTKQQVEILKSFDCDQAYGKHFSEPIVAFELQEFLR